MTVLHANYSLTIQLSAKVKSEMQEDHENVYVVFAHKQVSFVMQLQHICHVIIFCFKKMYLVINDLSLKQHCI